MGGGFDVQVEQEVRVRPVKGIFDCLTCLRQGADVPSV